MNAFLLRNNFMFYPTKIELGGSWAAPVRRSGAEGAWTEGRRGWLQGHWPPHVALTNDASVVEKCGFYTTKLCKFQLWLHLPWLQEGLTFTLTMSTAAEGPLLTQRRLLWWQKWGEVSGAALTVSRWSFLKTQAQRQEVESRFQAETSAWEDGSAAQLHREEVEGMGRWQGRARTKSELLQMQWTWCMHRAPPRQPFSSPCMAKW